MTILWLTLMFSYMFALLARYFSVPAGLGSSTATVTPNRLYAVLAASTLILVSGLRNNIGDTFFYMHAYEVNDFSWYAILQQKDIGFNLLQKLLKEITDDPQLLIFLMALFTNILIVAALYRYSRLFEVAVFIYITSGAYIVSMNGMRQYFAAAIVIAATKYLIKGRWKPYFAIVLLAAVFHQSALIMLPIYFLVRRRAWTVSSFVLLSMAVVIVFGFNQFQNLLFAALKDTSYGEYQQFQEGGASVIRVIFYALPLFVAYFGRDKLRKLYPNIDVFVNLSIIGVVIMIISTQNWIFARMAIYFSLYQIVLISWIIKIFREKDQKLIYVLLLGLYLFFFFFENVVTLGLEYRSDYLTWFR
ncbi:EpsG family protein [Cohnella soli]|uniref:EpsG family protein n=1 Tax=Cohnella soli TaxID=425005 RepID=A0ABW0I2R0_9BACL